MFTYLCFLCLTVGMPVLSGLGAQLRVLLGVLSRASLPDGLCGSTPRLSGEFSDISAVTSITSTVKTAAYTEALRGSSEYPSLIFYGDVSDTGNGGGIVIRPLRVA